MTVLSIYCCGRMWRLWMRESYLSSFCSQIRRKPLPTIPVPKALGSDTEVVREYEAWIGLLTFGLGVYLNSYSLVQAFPQSPALADFKPWAIGAAVSCTLNSSADNYMVRPFAALVSYWVDISNNLGNTTNLTVSSDLTVISQPIGIAFLAWGGTVVFMGLLPWILLAAAEAVGVAVAIVACIVCCIRGRCCPKRNRWAKPAQAAKKRPEATHCACVTAVWVDRFAIIIFARPLMWAALPWPLAQFFLPEHLQLPGVLLVLTGILVWMYYVWIRHVQRQWKEGRYEPYLRRFRKLTPSPRQADSLQPNECNGLLKPEIPS
ncbi:uncharacterized protein LOC129592907 isoform X2 [Paramacrobiotus metropolitanus]|uniref:uncharacterized protein LOC129592907 isoform X2 n=1 Tax=Paramacrobiotus metropolitanus TaxID=2943436 RepID=UPI0024459B03|nr:uncharacterized protein LOC129592907 isoform X2 [Paramacrobiotus metropolitanus]